MIMSECLTSETLERYRRGALESVAEMRAIDSHLSDCPVCEAALRSALQGAVVPLARALTPDGGAECLAHDLLWRYAGGEADAADAEIVETHVEDCARCRADLATLRAFQAEITEEDWATARAAAQSSYGNPQEMAQKGVEQDPTAVRRLLSRIEQLVSTAQTWEREVRKLIASMVGPEAARPCIPLSPALRSQGETNPGFTLIDPVGKVVLTDRPTFAWTPMPGATEYQITVTDQDYNSLFPEARVTETTWQPDQPLPHGLDLVWEVQAFCGSEQPLQQAAFRVLDRETADRIASLRRDHPDFHLALGLLYKNACVWDGAEQEIRTYLEANPHSSAARELLDELQALQRSR